ncbi:hypothetical protein MTR_7g108808 [Medicago truncatula]|uniref:Uncharacterized protein n=1 Tax=Medicago truncatula TaxID=3880 RepID=A0A072U3X5_MEDTR|nr:hypothetical protein MTR_7g108808 [Medicago truncatula]
MEYVREEEGRLTGRRKANRRDEEGRHGGREQVGEEKPYGERSKEDTLNGLSKLLKELEELKD